jgi:hypothetical protein
VLSFNYFSSLVDERGEIGLISRAITITSNSNFGSHMMVLKGGVARIEAVLFEGMGQDYNNRYPLNFFMAWTFSLLLLIVHRQATNKTAM